MHPSVEETRARSVLVVDDSEAVRIIVSAVLLKLGFEEIDEAEDGSVALSRLQDRVYDLVISDWNMEPVTGYELLRRMRADQRLRGLPFVMMTTDTDPQKMVAAKRAGVTGCLIKPFTVAALRERLGALLD